MGAKQFGSVIVAYLPTSDLGPWWTVHRIFSERLYSLFGWIYWNMDLFPSPCNQNPRWLARSCVFTDIFSAALDFLSIAFEILLKNAVPKEMDLGAISLACLSFAIQMETVENADTEVLVNFLDVLVLKPHYMLSFFASSSPWHPESLSLSFNELRTEGLSTRTGH